MVTVSKKTRVLSLLIAGLGFVVFSGLAVVIFRGMSARSLLESKNDCERTINVLFSSLRNYENFGTAIEGLPVLSQKMVGISVFGSTQNLLYRWGTSPTAYPSVTFSGGAPAGPMEEMFIGNPRDNSQIVLVRPQRPPAPPSEGTPPASRPREPRHESTFTATVFRQADLIYLEIRQPRYWQEVRLQRVLFPATELFLLLLVAFIWFLVVKNLEYRHEAERQKNLVMLGTAASTLAHEIKNPLLSIRLQTEILSRSLSGNGAIVDGTRELSIIDDEVERLSQLSTRVNDVLRDPIGNPAEIDPIDIAAETSLRLCGRSVVSLIDERSEIGLTVWIDPERLRSIIENLLRNALESEGPPQEVAIEVSASGANVYVDVLDRGSGIPEPQRETAFDPFYTTKSRGTGIGLAICRRFAQAAHGEVRLEERAGGGLRARLILPRKTT